MKIAVYYISTGPYNVYFDSFLTSLTNFFPNDNKVVKVISDGLTEYKEYEKNNIKVQICPRINHYPWPIITLYKMWHILENFDMDCDFHAYFNANAIIFPNDVKDWFDENKLNVSYHAVLTKPDIGHSSIFANNINTLSDAYINGDYQYIQGGFFIANTQIFKEMCKSVVNMINNDAKKQIYAQWHDESYLNKWCVSNENLVNRKFIMTTKESLLTNETFILIRNKNEKINEFKNK